MLTMQDWEQSESYFLAYDDDLSLCSEEVCQCSVTVEAVKSAELIIFFGLI